MSKQSRAPLGALDTLRRYPVEPALELLGYGRKRLYEDIRAGRIKVIREGLKQRTLKDGRVIEVAGRTYVPGSEIARLSQAPDAT
jgi:predicted site-specific integrase-resolvase